MRKVFVSDVFIDIDNVKSSFLDHLGDIFKNIVCILNCHSLSNTCICMSFPFSSFCIIIFSLSLIIIFLTICAVFGVRDFVFCFSCFFFFSPSLLCVPYFTPRLFLSLSVTEIFSCDKKKNSADIEI